MNWKLPNILTLGRIVLALGFFVLLGLFDAAKASGPVLLNAALVVYLAAGVSDVLDGYFARKWNLVSAFGRMVDPLVDKVLVIGAFVMLLGRNFGRFAGDGAGAAHVAIPPWLTGGMLSAVQPWMVVAVLVRELVVSGVRGYSESRGRSFPATWGGKCKMFLQSVAICAVLFQLANLRGAAWAAWGKVILVNLAVLVTVLTGLLYIGRARDLLRAEDSTDSAPR